MLNQKNWSIFALRHYLLKIELKTEVLTSEVPGEMGRAVRRDGPPFLGKMTHVIVDEKITKEEAKLFTTTDVLKFYFLTLNK